MLATACAPIDAGDPSDRPTGVRADGERGRGLFATPWGVEEVEYEWRNGLMIHEGDLVLDPRSEIAPGAEGAAREALLSRAALKWEIGADGVVTIPYAIANTGDLGATTFDRTRDRIVRAMEHWETYARRPDGRPLLRFVSHADETRWVQFQVKNNGGVCYVSLTDSGKTRVDSDPSCRWQTYVHEVGHVLTFRHEQKRSDRPGNVTFHAERTNRDSQFTMVSGGNVLGTPYDSYSIMHYPSCMFALSRCTASTPGAWVLERNRGTRYISWWTERAIGEVISPVDVCGIRTLYGLRCEDEPGTSGPDAGADGGVGTTPDGGVPDGGVPDAGAPPAALLPIAGALQSYVIGGAVCAESGEASIALSRCDEALATQRWAFAPTGALRSDGSARCAEPTGTFEGAIVEARECRASDAQRFVFGDVELVNGLTGMCLTVPAGGHRAGQALVYDACMDALGQRFAYLPDTHELKAAGWCVTSGGTDGATVALAACDGRPEQRWIEANGGLAAAGLCLQVSGGARAAAGAAMIAGACNGASGQMWGLRGMIAHADDELCLAASEGGSMLELAACAATSPDRVLIWWPRMTCSPLSCGEVGASCGSFDDGCGAPLECGECPFEPSHYDGGVDCDPCDDPTPLGGGSGCACTTPAVRRSPGGVAIAALALLAIRARRRRPRRDRA